MRWRSPRPWIALGSAALVVGIALVDIERVSPGPLSAVHGRDPELVDPSSCDACHGGWFESMGDACLSCHEVIGRQIDAGEGLHGVLGGDGVTACGPCHGEHHGVSFAIVNRRSFALAGIPDPSAFDHARIGYPMAGRHLELACAECHRNADVAVLPEGARRFVGLDRSCATCHEDPHEGHLGSVCADCHTQADWEELLPAGHDAFLPLVGGHGDVACRDCHARDGRHSLEVLTRGVRQPARTCAGCHESPHAPAFADGTAALAARSSGEACVVCHRPEHAAFREPGLTVTPEQHEFSGFPLVEPHDDVACATCHRPAAEAFGTRYPGRDPDRCAACHEDVHGGQFATGQVATGQVTTGQVATGQVATGQVATEQIATGQSAGAGCLDCHERTRWEPHVFTAARHERTALPLEGRHAEADCHACHERAHADAPRTFRGTPATCAACHDDAHDGAFDRVAAAVREDPAGDGAAPRADCALCHTATRFAERPGDGFDHAHWTGFPVRDAHAQAACEACHPRADEPDATGRTFGRVEEHFGSYSGCVTCHVDPHRGAFDGEAFPAEIEGRTDCARCHVESSFRAFPDGFDHGTWTGFALEGGHAGVGCTPCHAPRRRPDEFGRTWDPAVGARCAQCHEDAHAGQFSGAGTGGGIQDCERCHASAEGWDELAFRHNVHARFRLDEAHDGLDCSACHVPHRVGDETVVRYRPLGTRCVDCHAGQEDPLSRKERSR